MASLYSQQKGKLGANVGFIFPFVVTINSADPDDPSNSRILPAGFLKCDGTVYDADDFSALAGVTGTGSDCKFKGDRVVNEGKFRVPDLGAKVIRASLSDIGTVNDATVESSSGATINKAGVAVTIENQIGPSAEIGYSGLIKIPQKIIDLNVNPGLTYARNTEYSEVQALEMQPHAHYSSTVRVRVKDNLLVDTFTYANFYKGKFGADMGGGDPDGSQPPKEFDTNIQDAVYVAVRNQDEPIDTGGDSTKTNHRHGMIFSGSEYTNPSTASNHSYQVTLGKSDGTGTTVFPDGLLSKATLKDSGATKFDDVSSPFILVQYIIKF